MWAVVSIAKNWRSSCRERNQRPSKPKLSIRKQVGVQAHSSNVPPGSHDAAFISRSRCSRNNPPCRWGAEQPERRHFSSPNSRLVKAVEALRCGKIIALPTVRSGFPCDWKWHSLFPESFLRTRFMGSRQEFALSQVYGLVRQFCLARDE